MKKLILYGLSGMAMNLLAGCSSDNFSSLGKDTSKQNPVDALFKNLSFAEAFHIVDEVAFDNFKNSQERKISYWIKKAIQKGRDNIRILSSDDDMINTKVDTDLIDTPYLLTIPHGGHFGYRQMAWFDELLIRSLTLSESDSEDKFKLALFQKQEGQ